MFYFLSLHYFHEWVLRLWYYLQGDNSPHYWPRLIKLVIKIPPVKYIVACLYIPPDSFSDLFSWSLQDSCHFASPVNTVASHNNRSNTKDYLWCVLMMSVNSLRLGSVEASCCYLMIFNVICLLTSQMSFFSCWDSNIHILKHCDSSDGLKNLAEVPLFSHLRQWLNSCI